MASNLKAAASNLIAMASNIKVAASNLIAMACNGLETQEVWMTTVTLVYSCLLLVRHLFTRSVALVTRSVALVTRSVALVTSKKK